MAAVDYFLKLDGIKGESQDAKHKDEIEVQSWSWGETQSGTGFAGGGSGAGKVVMQDFHFVAKVSKATPELMLHCATGKHIKQADLVCRKAGTDQQEFMKYKLTDVLVSSVQAGGSAQSDVVPTDQFSLNFAKIEWEYAPQKADGSLDSPVKGGWDVKAHKKV